MTKKDIVRTISEETGLTQQQTKDVVQRTFDAIIDCLAHERRIELRNFGVFEVKLRGARTARNPRTGEKVEVPDKYVVTFKSGKEMEAKVNEPAEKRPGSNSPLFPPNWTARRDSAPAGPGDTPPPRDPT